MKYIKLLIHKIKNDSIPYALISCIVLGFYIVSYYTPLYGDDFIFTFINAPEELKKLSPFYNYFDLYTNNFAGVARFVPHLMVAFFTLIMGKTIFNICAAFGFIILSYLIASIATIDKRGRLYLTIICAAITWFMLTGFFHAYLWMAGACNYMFVALLVLLFYKILISESHPTPRWWSIPLWFAFGFLTGWTNEGFIVGFSCATCIYYLFIRRSSLNRRRFCMLSGLWIGTVCLCLTPFNLFRFFSSHDTDISIIQMGVMFGKSILYFDNMYIGLLLLMTVGAATVMGRLTKLGFKEFLKDEFILILSWGISLLFLAFTGFVHTYTHVPTEIYALTILCAFFSRFFLKSNIQDVAIIAGCAMITCYFIVIPICASNFKIHEKMEYDIKNGNKLVVADNLDELPFASRYYSTVMEALFCRPFRMSKLVSEYYGGSSETFILSRPMYDVLNDYQEDKHFVIDPDIGSLWIRNDNKPDPDRITLLVHPVEESNMNFMEKIVAPYLDRYSMTRFETTDFVTADILGHHWIVLRNYPYISKRIYDVQLQ